MVHNGAMLTQDTISVMTFTLQEDLDMYFGPIRYKVIVK